MGVISCRSREASLIPNYIRLKRRRNDTTVMLEPKGGDAKSMSPGLEKASELYRERETLHSGRDQADRSTGK